MIHFGLAMEVFSTFNMDEVQNRVLYNLEPGFGFVLITKGEGGWVLEVEALRSLALQFLQVPYTRIPFQADFQTPSFIFPQKQSSGTQLHFRQYSSHSHPCHEPSQLR